MDGRVLWANLHLLFWLSLIPFATGWMGENHFAAWPVALYGTVLLFAAVAYFILVRTLIALHGSDSVLATAVGSDFKGKLSIGIYFAAYLAGLHKLLDCLWAVRSAGGHLVHPRPAHREVLATLIGFNGIRRISMEMKEHNHSGHPNHGGNGHTMAGMDGEPSPIDDKTASSVQHGAGEEMTGETEETRMDQATMDHSGMDHATMENTEMNHGAMDHAAMDHTEMDHGVGSEHAGGGHAAHADHTGHEDMFRRRFWVSSGALHPGPSVQPDSPAAAGFPHAGFSREHVDRAGLFLDRLYLRRSTLSCRWPFQKYAAANPG